MRENRDFVVPVNILTTFAHAPFSWAARHTTVCLDISTWYTKYAYIYMHGSDGLNWSYITKLTNSEFRRQ